VTASVQARDEAAFYNPAHLADLLALASAGHKAETGERQPIGLAYACLVLCLTPVARDRLPRAVTTQHMKWMEDNPYLRFRIAQVAPALAPLTKRALLLGVSHRLLDVDSLLTIGSLRSPAAKTPRRNDDGAEPTRWAAHFTGRWLSKGASVPPTLATFGLKL
jgi:hypothetical protein